MDVLKQRWLSYLVVLAIGFAVGLVIGKSGSSTTTASQAPTTNLENTDSTSTEKSGYILDSNMTR